MLWTLKLILMICIMGMCTPAFAQESHNKKLPVPRFVSLKSDKVNVRQGPSRDHEVLWIFNRAGLPVEILAEYENWRRIRDSEGAEGWVLQNLLSGKRTILVAPWLKGSSIASYNKPDETEGLRARLQAGLMAKVEMCDKRFCQISGQEFEGYIRQDQLFGVYPNETIGD